MNPIAPSRIIAGIFGMAAFAIAVLAGLHAGNPTSDILVRALYSTALCYVAGFLVGTVCEYVINEHMRRYRNAHPVPDSDAVIDQMTAAKQTGDVDEVTEV